MRIVNHAVERFIERCGFEVSRKEAIEYIRSKTKGRASDTVKICELLGEARLDIGHDLVAICKYGTVVTVRKKKW